jgi:hypothetical protein
MSRRGWDVYATARSSDALQSLGRIPNVHAIPLDITDRAAIAALPGLLPAELNGVVNNAGIVVNKNVEGSGGATWRARSEWQKDGVALVQEDLVATGKVDGPATILDLVYTLTAIADDVRLAHCNVGGLALPVRYDGVLTAHGPEGPVERPSAVYRKDETNWPAAAWYGYTVKLPSGQVISAAIIDHPSNPESRWHCAKGARVINPNITTFQERPLRKASPLTLRYRVLALDGEFDRERLSRWREEFADARLSTEQQEGQ